MIEAALEGGTARWKDLPAGAEPAVRASLVRWLCTSGTAARNVDPRGVRIHGLQVNGKLDLSYSSIPFALELTSCDLDEVDVCRATAVRISLNGSRLSAFRGDGLRTSDDLVFQGGTAKAGVHLTNADVRGDLKLTGTTVEAPPGAPEERVAFDLNGAHVGGGLFLDRGFHSVGSVRLWDVIVDEGIEFNEGFFQNPRGAAISADRIRVAGSVFLRGAVAEGEVRFHWGRIEGEVAAGGARFINPGAESLVLYGCSVRGPVDLVEGVHSEGMVNFAGSTIGGTLNCTGAFLTGDTGAKNTTDDSLRFAFNGNRMDVKGHVTFERATLRGGVTLIGAGVGADLSCKGATLLVGEPPEDGEPYTLRGERLRVAGSAEFTEGFRTDGLLDLGIARVGANLKFTGASFFGNGINGLHAEHLHVERDLAWKLVKRSGRTDVRLEHAYAARLDDDPSSWVVLGKVRLNGFKYETLSFPSDEPNSWPPGGGDARPFWQARSEWLHAEEEDGGFHPQPYDHLSSVLRRSGFEDDAREVEIAKGKAWRRSGSLTLLGRLRNLVLHWFVGYGYKPSRAVAWSVGIVLIGFVVYGWGAREGVITPAKERVRVDSAAILRLTHDTGRDTVYRRVPTLSPLAYSVDVFLPIVNLNQEEYWLPNAGLDCESSPPSTTRKPTCGQMLRYYHWFHILVGWALTTLAVVGFTGLVRR